MRARDAYGMSRDKELNRLSSTPESHIVRYAHEAHPTHSAGRRETGHSDPRHGRRHHHVHRRRGSHQAGHGQADRLDHPAEHHPPGQAHRQQHAENQGFRAAGEDRRSGIRRLGHLRRKLLRSRAACRRAGKAAARKPARSAREDQAHAGRLRQRICQAHQRSQPEAERLQDGSRRDADGRHPATSRNVPALRGWP